MDLWDSKRFPDDAELRKKIYLDWIWKIARDKGSTRECKERRMDYFLDNMMRIERRKSGKVVLKVYNKLFGELKLEKRKVGKNG